jgi:DHA1 family tetracycline resistance protein-like MFS transporter
MKKVPGKKVVFFTVLIDLIGFGLIIPIMGPTGAEFMPAHPGMAMALLMGSYSMMQIFFAPFWGRLSDRHGRRPIILFSLAGSTASYLLFALSGSFSLLLFSRILAGVFGANITAAQSYIADVTPDQDRTAGMGLIGMAFGLGFAIGPVLGGLSSWAWTSINPEAYAHIGPGVLGTVICGLNLVAAFYRLPESLPKEKWGKVRTRRFASISEIATVLRHPTIGPLILLFFVITFAFAKMESVFSIFAKEVMDQSNTGIYKLMIFIGLVIAFVQGYFIRKAVQFIPEQIWMIVGSAVLCLGLVLLPTCAHPGWIYLPLAILSAGHGMASPCLMSLISMSAGDHEQGNVLGTNQSGSALARLLGPILGGGIFYDMFGPGWPFWIAAFIMGCATIGAIRIRWTLIRHGFGVSKIKPDLEKV